MNIQLNAEPGFALVSTTESVPHPYAGAFFPGARGFTIGGGAFTSNVNVTNNVCDLPPQEQLSAFRTILLGDINLIKEICLGSQCGGVVGRQTRGPGVRRIYSAELAREVGRVTVAMYEGNDAEKWQQDVAKYQSIRHPNIMQVYGLVRTGGLCAMVFHNELIPLRQFLRRFQHSPILSTYIIGYCTAEWRAALWYYMISVCTWDNPDANWSLWIHLATGALCVDLIQAEETDNQELPDSEDIERVEKLSLDDPHAENVVISNLDSDDYHDICSDTPMAQFRRLSFPTQPLVPLGPTILYFDSQRKAVLRITWPLDLDCENILWREGGKAVEGELLANSWIRYNSRQVRGLDLRTEVYSQPHSAFWMAQANYIFSQLQETSHWEDYVCVHQFDFTLRCLPNPASTHEPDGYLFVCPPEDFQTGPHLFQWPDCPAFWSLDPSGAFRLSSEQASILGFPIIHIETHLLGQSWDTTVYHGLRQFHQGKGFNPDSQEVAMDLGYPLYELRPMSTYTPIPCGEHGWASLILWLTYIPKGELEGWKCNLEDDALCHEFGHYL